MQSFDLVCVFVRAPFQLHACMLERMPASKGFSWKGILRLLYWVSISAKSRSSKSLRGFVVNSINVGVSSSDATLLLALRPSWFRVVCTNMLVSRLLALASAAGQFSIAPVENRFSFLESFGLCKETMDLCFVSDRCISLFSDSLFFHRKPVVKVAIADVNLLSFRINRLGRWKARKQALMSQKLRGKFTHSINIACNLLVIVPYQNLLLQSLHHDIHLAQFLVSIVPD